MMPSLRAPLSFLQVGSFSASLAQPAEFVKRRPIFAPYVNPDENAPVLELNGRARWQVEREGRQKGATRTTSNNEEAAQSSIYTNLLSNPLNLQGYSYPTEP
jgi:hypothetical protein